MAKVITLSVKFPSYHPDKGKPTLFPEKVWKSLLNSGVYVADYIYEVGRKLGGYQYADEVLNAVDNSEPKHHTIREGKRWKDGDMASLRVWSGVPYNSPQITIAPDVKLVVKDVKMANGLMWIDGKKVSWDTVAGNDGLTMQELRWWFNKPVFDGQILIWNNNNLPY